MVLQALTLVHDEVHWLVKHNNAPTPKGKHKPNPDDYSDPALSELLFLTVQLKGETSSNCQYYTVPVPVTCMHTGMLISPPPLSYFHLQQCSASIDVLFRTTTSSSWLALMLGR